MKQIYIMSKYTYNNNETNAFIIPPLCQVAVCMFGPSDCNLCNIEIEIYCPYHNTNNTPQLPPGFGPMRETAITIIAYTYFTTTERSSRKNKFNKIRNNKLYIGLISQIMSYQNFK